MSLEFLQLLAAAMMVATLAGVTLARDAATRTALAIGGGVAVLGVHAFAMVGLQVDDSYITYRYARNFADGLGPVWNEGERVEGYTSFLWMALLAAMHVVGIDIELAAVLLASASMIALFLLMWRVLLRLSEGADAPISPQLVLAGAALLVAGNASIGVWSVSGLEVPLAAALVMALVLTFQRESRVAMFPASSLVLAAAVMTRPEANVLVPLTGAFFLHQSVRENTAARWRHLALFVAVFAVIAGGWFLWRWSYYGYIFPNTYYVKVGPAPDMIDRGWEYVSTYLWAYLIVPALLAAAALPFLARGAARRDAVFVFATTVAWLGAVIYEGGDAFDNGRFVAPVIAPLYVAALVSLRRLLARVRVAAWCKTAAFAAGIIGASLFVMTPTVRDDNLSVVRRAAGQWQIEGQWYRENAPREYLVAVTAAGLVPYFSRMPSLDMLGLNDETIAHAEVPNFGKGLAGHEKYDIDYVLDERRPEIIASMGVFPLIRSGSQLRDVTGSGPGIVPGLTKLLQDGRTWERYEMAAFFFDGYWYHFLVRKDIAQNVNAGWTDSEGLINQGRGRR